MTPEQVAEYLQLRKDTVYRYIRDGKLAAIRLGRSYRVRKEDLDDFLHQNAARPEFRAALFRRVAEIGERNADLPWEEVERDVAEVIAEVRHERRLRREREAAETSGVLREESPNFEA